MAEYLVKTDKPIRLDEVLHLHGIHHYSVQRLEKHGRLIDADRLAEAFKVFATGSEIGYLRLINEAPTVLEASNE